MAQMNPTVGDIAGNVRRIMAWLREAKKAKADLVTFPELAITGYPPEDLLLKPQFVADNRRGLQEVVRHCRGLAAVVGYVSQSDELDPKQARSSVVQAGAHELYNAAAVIADQTLITTYCKWYLPNYGVFDESRYFHQASGFRSFACAARWSASTFARISGCRTARPGSWQQQALKLL